MLAFLISLLWFSTSNSKRSLVEMAHESEADGHANARALTPEQFEESLTMDKLELELDNQLNLQSQIDTLTQINKETQPILDEKAGTVIEPEQPTATSKSNQEEPLTDTQEIPEAEGRFPLELQHPEQKIPQKVTIHRPKKKTLQESFDDQEATIEFHFEDADLQTFINYISEIYDINFITADELNPLPKNTKALRGNKISFKTHKPLTKKEAWNLFLAFLDIAGFAVVPEADPKFYKIMQTEAARKAPIPAYIGVKPDMLPDNDQLIRYVYFVENAALATIKDIIDSLRSPASAFVVLNELNGFLLTDKSYNIKSLMAIVTELDRVTQPQAMSVLKLRRADAEEVKKLYDNITQTEEAKAATMFPAARKQPTALYFPENTRIIAEPRSNALILLGPKDAIKKIEEFIINYVDVELGKIYSPLHVYTLKFADATTIANIMNEITQFGKDTPAGRVGGVRDEDKYLKALTFTPEPATNRLIIRGDEEDYLKAKEILDSLDEEQPQVAIELLILSLDLIDKKNLGTQLRSKTPGGIDGLVGPNVKFQTSGSAISGVPAGIITNPPNGIPAPPGVDRLLGNLINLVTGSIPGNTVVQLGTDAFGVWGIFNVLQTITNTQVVSNPFIVTTNKKAAKISVGELRRVVSGLTVGATTQESFANDAANLEINVTPQINSDGMIVLNLDVQINNFTNTTNFQDATKNIRQVTTSTIVADREILALGGLIQNTIITNTTKVPILGNIPIIGWLFKNRQLSEVRDNLLILISSRIIKPDVVQATTPFTKNRIRMYQDDINAMQDYPDKRDPIHRWFFTSRADAPEHVVDDFLFDRQKKNKLATINKKKKKKSLETVEPTNPGQEMIAANPKKSSASVQLATNQPKSLPRKKRSMLESMLSDDGVTA